MFSIFKKNRSLRKSFRSVNAPIYYLNEEPVYQTPSDDELFENIYGDGLEVDEMTIMKAREGNEKDLLKIGYVYFSRHTRNDYLKALDWFIKAAEKNSAEAEFRIAELYSKGQGVENDHGKSFEWCLKAAKKGHIDALNKMGWSYLEGWGVAVDKKKAIYWFTKAADKGDWIAQEQLDSLRDDNVSFSDDVHIEFTDEDFKLDTHQDEVELPMEVSEDKTAELKEIMLKYERLQKELEDEKRRRDEEIAKRDEEMKDMAKAIEVLQSSMSDAAIDSDDQTPINASTNSTLESITQLSADRTNVNGQSTSYTESNTQYNGIVRTNKNVYCESPLEDTSDWKSEDGQDPNYDTPEEEEEEEEEKAEQDLNYDSPEEEEQDKEQNKEQNKEQDEEQVYNYNSPNEDKDEDKQEETEEQALNYDSPDEDSKPSIRNSTMPARSESKSHINRINTL